jgi:hypothetical protein
VTLLPDREVATVQAWLAGHPDIKVLSRLISAFICARGLAIQRGCRQPSR